MALGLKAEGVGRRAARWGWRPLSARWNNWLTPILGLLVALAVWDIYARMSIVPQPYEILLRIYELSASGELLRHVIASLSLVLRGFALGSLLGVVVGTIWAIVPLGRAIVPQFVEILRPIPPIAWIPLAILWLGLGDASKIFIICISAFFPSVTNTYKGIAQIDNEMIRVARSVGASTRQVLLTVQYPAALPQIMTGIRVSLSLSLTTVIAAEMIAAQVGVGYMIWRARLFADTPTIMAGMVVIGVLNLGLNCLQAAAEKRFLHWHQHANESL